jgi:hypothetical protein
MMSPIKNFDPNTDPIELQSQGSLRTIARRIKTRALRAAGQACSLVARLVGGACALVLIAAAVVAWPLLIAVECAVLASACDDGHRARVTMPRQDATTHASDVNGGGQ